MITSNAHVWRLKFMKTRIIVSVSCLKVKIVLAALLAMTGMALANTATWNAVVNSSANTNWSTTGNWTVTSGGGGGGGAASGDFQNACIFNDATGVTLGTATTNSVVNATQNPFSVSFTNYTTQQNVLILPGQTLLIGTGGLTNGSTATATSLNPVTTISGPGGALVVSNGSVNVGLSFSSTSGSCTLNMTNLDTFTATNIANLDVGVSGGVRTSGILYLAKTNYIYFSGASSSTSPHLDVGNNGGNNGPGSKLYLGLTNVISVNDIGIGLQKQDSGTPTIQFNPSFQGNNPTVYIYGTNGPGSRVSTWAMGDGQTTSGTMTETGVASFTNGTVNASVNSMWLARNSPKANSTSPHADGTLSISAGVINVNNLTNGVVTSTTNGPAINGTIFVAGTGTLSVNTNFVFAATNGLVGPYTASFTCNTYLYINGGTVLANNIVNGGANASSGYNVYISMNGGLLSVTNTLGTANSPINNLILGNSATLQFGSVSTSMTDAPVNSLTLNDSSTVVNISTVPQIISYPTLFPVMSYQSGGGSGAISLGTLPGTYQGFISNDTVSTFWLWVTNGPTVPKTDEWGGGVNDVWDTSTLNWTNSGVAVAYKENDLVTFDDTAQTGTVNLATAHTPDTCTVTNNTLNYTFTGSGLGGLTGFGLVKWGQASLTLSESGDNFGGGITVNGGTLTLDNTSSAITGGLTIASGATVQIGNNDVKGNLPSGAVSDNGTLVFSQTITNLVSNAISGGGILVQYGSGELALSSASGFTGNTLAFEGTLALTNSGSISSSANVIISNATFDTSGTAGVTTLNNLSLNNAIINLGDTAYLQSPLYVDNLSMGGTTNTINVASLPPIASYPVIVTLVQSTNTISGFNIGLGTLPAGSPAYAGSISETNNTALVLTLTVGPTNTRPYVTWSGADVPNLNTNWSDNLNWQTPGAPLPSEYVIFSDVAAASGTPFSAIGDGAGGIVNPGNINNIIDVNFTISEFNYSNILSSDYQNTLLANGVTLNVISTNTSPRLFTVGSASSDYGTSAKTYVTIAGANGTVSFNNTNGMIYVGLGSGTSGGTQQATLDLSGLGTFDASVSTVLVGVGSSSQGIGLARQSGVLYLAQTNTIKASIVLTNTESSDTAQTLSIDVGDEDGNAGPGSCLYLGKTNAIYADDIGIGQQKSIGTNEFNPNFTGANTVYFRGASANAVNIFSIGDGVVNSGTANCTGICDYTTASGGADGYVNALVNTLYVGRGANNTSESGSATGILSFDNGIFNVGTVYLGYQPTNTSKFGQGTINIGTNSTLGVNGTLSVSGTLNLGLTTGGSGATTNSGVLNINGGTVYVNRIICGTSGTNAINLNGGTLAVTNTAGTPGAPIMALTLSSGTLQLNVNGSVNVTNMVATNITTSGTTTLKIGSLTSVATNTAYPLISYAPGTDPYSSLNPSLPNGYTGGLMDSNSVVWLVLTTLPVTTPPNIASFSISGNTLTITATNGQDNGPVTLQVATNLVPPVVWTTVLSTNFNSSGAITFTNGVNRAATPNAFYRLNE